MFTADLRRGEDYEKAKKCIVIAILGFDGNEFEEDWINISAEYHNVYMMRDSSGRLYTDVLELHTIELNKKPSGAQPNPLDEWHSLFNAETEEELDMIKLSTRNKGIMEAIKELKEISLTDRMRYEYEMRLKAKRDRKAEDDYVREEEREKNIKILINTMREYELTDEQIVKVLVEKYSLSREEAIERLH